MNRDTYLDGLSLAFFRGIGPEEQLIGPFSKFNIFIGPNNSGKSTVLDFICSQPPLSEKKIERPTDEFRGNPTGQLICRLGISIENAKSILRDAQVYQKEIQFNLQSHQPSDKLISYISIHDLVWLKYNRSGHFELHHNTDLECLSRIFDAHIWEKYSRVLTGIEGGRLNEWIKEVLEYFGRLFEPQFPQTYIIPTIRFVGEKGSRFGDLSGAGLIDKIAEIQSPDHDSRSDYELFEKINRFVQDVLDKKYAKIEVPHNRQHVLVHMDDKVLPLSSLGTGVSEVIMIAAFCTIYQNSIICIEEPESHLHPVLQRRLINYLDKNTSNQYMISTHSPSFIDVLGARIFQVDNDGHQTRVRNATIRREKANICRTLGYRASDILQSNYVIWVEGPSDRIYLNKWIRDNQPDLVEGIHYSIMFYGGRLLSHLTASDDEVTDFISLRALNQHLAIVIDSDKTGARSEINSTKRRIQDEITESGGTVWITAGREIENYIDPEILHEVIREMHADVYVDKISTTKFSKAYQFRKRGPSSNFVESADKVKLARRVCERSIKYDRFDLSERIHEVVSQIRVANGLS